MSFDKIYFFQNERKKNKNNSYSKKNKAIPSLLSEIV